VRTLISASQSLQTRGMMDSLFDPEQLVTGIADDLKTELPAATTFKVSRLSERLMRLDISSQETGSARITLLVSTSGTAFEAGVGTRFEFGQLPVSRDAIVGRAQAVADGRLVEWVGENRTDFELTMRDGQVLRGGVMEGLFRLRRKRANRIEYLPFMGPA